MLRMEVRWCNKLNYWVLCMLDLVAYKAHLLDFISKVTVLHERYFELKVFEHEWQTILENAFIHANKNEHTIIIKNIYVYRGFRWDKYHVLLSDILSICNNEKKVEASVIQNLYHHINYNLIGLDDDAKTTFLDHIKYIYNIEYVDIKINSDANKRITGKLSKLIKLITSERNYLSHKHEVDAINRYESSLQDANKVLEQLRSILQYLTKIASGMYLLTEHKNLKFNFVKSHKHVNDQIDMILFGKSELELLNHYYKIQRMEFYRNNMNKIIQTEIS